MLIYIVTRPDREKLYQGTYQSLLSVGIDKKNIRKVIGYDATKFYDKRKCVACCFQDNICPFNESDFLYVEDGAIFNENPLACIKDRSTINWLGYIKKSKSFVNYGKKNNCIYIHPHTIISQMEYDSAFGTPTQIEAKNKLKKKLVNMA